MPRDAADTANACLRSLEDVPWPQNLNVIPLTDKRPWMRVRIGDFRIFLRPLTEDELREYGAEPGDDGFWVARVVNKKDAGRALRKLR